MAAPSPTIDIESEVFALRLANLLRATRLERGRSLRALAKASGARYTREQLRQFEAGGVGLDEDVVEDLSEIYGADLGTILPSRLPVAIAGGVISAGGVTATFVPTNGTSLLTAYLRLIRSMRRQKKAPMIVLRREDIEVIADYLDEPGETIVDRLTALMGATLTQRTAMATMFATGAIVIGLAGSTAARSPDTGAAAGPRLNDHTVEVVTDATASLDDAVVAPGGVESAPRADEAALASDHDVESLTTAAAAAATAPADAPAVDPEVVDPSTSSSAGGSSGGAAVSDVAGADASSTDASPADGASTDATVVDSGSSVIPDLPYGDAVVIDDGSDPWTSADPWGSNDPADGSTTVVPPVILDTPVLDTPATDTPATDTPATDTPATDTPPVPAIDVPIVPAVDEVPVVDEIPVTATPVVEEPAVEEPAVEVASEAPVPAQTLIAADAKAPPVETRSERRAAAKQVKRDLKAAGRVAAKVARIDAKATAAIERATNTIDIEIDEERLAALKVIAARAETTIARTSRSISANGGGPRAAATIASVTEEIYAKADADREAILDWISARAAAEKAEVVTVTWSKAAAARAALARS